MSSRVSETVLSLSTIPDAPALSFSTISDAPHAPDALLSLSTIPDAPDAPMSTIPDAPDAPHAPRSSHAPHSADARHATREEFVQQYMNKLLEQHSALMAGSVYDIVSVVSTLDKKADSLENKVDSLEVQMDALKRKVDANQSELRTLLRTFSAEVKEGFSDMQKRFQ